MQDGFLFQVEALLEFLLASSVLSFKAGNENYFKYEFDSCDNEIKKYAVINSAVNVLLKEIANITINFCELILL